MHCICPHCAAREAHVRVDHHGRTYYMDHNTRTIAYNGGSREEGGRATEVSPARQNPREMQTRREMLDRRYKIANSVSSTCIHVGLDT